MDTATTAPATQPFPHLQPSSTAVASISSLWNFLVSSAALREGAKLLLVGGILELARRAVGMVCTFLFEFFSISAEFEDRDETFKWMMFWLSRNPRWNKIRNVRVTTFRYGQSGVSNLVEGEEDGRPDPSRRLAYVPSYNKALIMWHNKTWMSVTINRTQGDMWNRRGDERLKIILFTRNSSKLDSLLREAKLSYKRHSEGRINIHVSDANNEWTLAGSRPRRSLKSVVLKARVKKLLKRDLKDFMSSEKWYAERGIPWRRGYLLHGSPGSGKTSIIHALAGELGLDIYVISLSKKALDDATLNELISRIPSRSLAIMEDIDVAFYRGVTRENQYPSGPEFPEFNSLPGNMSAFRAPSQTTSAVTLSGLLGAIDGIAAQEGRILFATTNKYSALDPALVRPGRLDVHIRFDNAGRWEAKALFRSFFPPRSDADEEEGFSDDTSSSPTAVGSSPGTPNGVNFPLYTDGTSSDEPSDGGQTDTEEDSEDGDSDRGDLKYHRPPSLSRAEVKRLSREFARRIPEREFSMASLQGFLMQYKTRPYAIVREVDEWVAEERQRRAEREGKTAPVISEDDGAVMDVLGPEQQDHTLGVTGINEAIDEKGHVSD